MSGFCHYNTLPTTWTNRKSFKKTVQICELIQNVMFLLTSTVGVDTWVLINTHTRSHIDTRTQSWREHDNIFRTEKFTDFHVFLVSQLSVCPFYLFTPALIGQKRVKQCSAFHPHKQNMLYSRHVRLHMPHCANFIARQNRRFFCDCKASQWLLSPVLMKSIHSLTSCVF